MGITYEKAGNGLDGHGLDCYTLCREVYRRLDKELPSFSHPEEANVIEQEVLGGKQLFVELEKPEPFCLVTFRVMGFVSHVGVVLEDCRSFIHILKKSRVSVERLDSLLWKKRIDGFFRLTEGKSGAETTACKM